ncbi:MAG: SH3 domain-containing protein [Chloroflexota bacterium]|nr:SH3 domain-containing protein [Chloroflexota bacterium]
MIQKAFVTAVLLTMMSFLAACGGVGQSLPGARVEAQTVESPVEVDADTTGRVAVEPSASSEAIEVVFQPAHQSQATAALTTETKSETAAVEIEKEEYEIVDIMLRGTALSQTSVHDLPDDASAVVGQLEANDDVIVTRAQGDWYEIIYFGDGSRHAWVPQLMVSLDSHSTEPVDQIAETSGQDSQEPQLIEQQPAGTQGTVLVSTLNARSGPGTESAVLGRLNQNETVTVVDRQDDWLQIVFEQAPGDLAWVSSDYVWLEGEEPPILSQSAVVVSPDSGLHGTLVFQTSSGGAIYTYDLDSGALNLLTHGLDPALSPDGRQVAFTRWEEPRGLYVIDVDGSNERLLLGGNLMKSPTWSPDGQQLVYNQQQGGRESQTFLTPRGEFTIPADPFWRLQVIGVDGQGLEGVEDKEHSFNPAWSDRGILFADTMSIYVTAPDGSPGLIYEGANFVRNPIWSPDGQTIIATMQFHDHWEVVRFNADGSGLTRLTQNIEGVNSVSPTWSPDSKQILYLSDANDDWQLWTVDVDGGNQTPLLSDALAEIDFQYGFMAEHVADWR